MAKATGDRRHVPAALLAVWFGIAGCHGCRESKPYVPFSVTGAASSAASSPPIASGSAETASSGFAVVVAQPPPGDPRSFMLGASKVSPRKGRLFRRVLAFDTDGDREDDLFAWTEAADSSKGELVFFHGGSKEASEAVLTKLPKDLDIGECSHETTVERIGNGVVAVIVNVDCGESHTKQEWVGVARIDPSPDPGTSKPPEVRLEARAKEPLALDVLSEDRDHDKIEDLVFVGHLIDDKGPDRVSASLVLWDRPAGYAWDPSEPEASLGKLGQSLLTRAVAKKPDSIARAENALKLVRSLCTDLGGNRFSSTAGAPKCQESRVIGDAVHTVAVTATNSGDLPRAVMAAETDAGLKFDHGRVAQIESLFAKKVKRVEASATRRTTAKPAKKSSGLLSPLMFDDAGGLLVAGDDEVTRVDLASGEEKKSDVQPWSRTVAWTSGDATVEIAAAKRVCPGAGVTVSAGARGGMSEVEIPVLGGLLPPSVKKDKCERASALVAPLLIDNNGAVLAIDGEVFRATYGDKGVTFERAAMPAPTDAASPTGSARSPDGKASVIAMPESLLVFRATGVERWKGADVKGAHDCVVTSAGDRVACVSGDTAAIFEAKPDTKPAKPPKAPKPVKKAK